MSESNKNEKVIVTLFVKFKDVVFSIGFIIPASLIITLVLIFYYDLPGLIRLNNPDQPPPSRVEVLISDIEGYIEEVEQELDEIPEGSNTDKKIELESLRDRLGFLKNELNSQEFKEKSDSEQKKTLDEIAKYRDEISGELRNFKSE